MVGEPSKVADCGMVQGRLHLADPTRWWGADPVALHSCMDKPGGTVGEQNRLCNPGLQLGEIEPQTSD